LAFSHIEDLAQRGRAAFDCTKLKLASEGRGKPRVEVPFQADIGVVEYAVVIDINDRDPVGMFPAGPLGEGTISGVCCAAAAGRPQRLLTRHFISA